MCSGAGWFRGVHPLPLASVGVAWRRWDEGLSGRVHLLSQVGEAMSISMRGREEGALRFTRDTNADCRFFSLVRRAGRTPGFA